MFDCGPDVTPSDPAVRMTPENINNLAARLSTVIEAGNVKEAQIIAASLAEHKAKINIEVLEPEISQKKEPEFSVKVYVEDKDTSGASMMINVRPSTTVGLLKQMIHKDYGFPEVIQKWIIGSMMPKDADLLKSCGINGPGAVMFLYLVSCRSVGLTKEEYLQQQAQERDPASVLRNNNSDDNNVYISMNLSNRIRPNEEEPEQTAIFPPAVPPPIQREADCHLGRRKPPPIPLKPPPKLTTVPAAKSPRDNAGLSIQTAQAALTAMLGTDVSPEAPLQRNPSQGWTCHKCTFINIPTRPGCAMCTASRPADYLIPADVTLPEEEQARLNAEFELDLQVQNVGEDDQGGRREASNTSGEDQLNLTPEQLDQLLKDIVMIPNSQQIEQSNMRSVMSDYSIPRESTRFSFIRNSSYPVMESAATENSESDDDNTDLNAMPPMFNNPYRD